MSNGTFDKDRFEASLKLAQFSAEQWDRRRIHEWRVSLTLWAAIAASLLRPEIKIPLWAGVVLLIGYVTLWLRPIWEANARDKERSRFYREESQTLLGCHPKGIKDALPYDDSWKAFFNDCAMIFHAATTAFLLIVVYATKGW